MLKLYRTQGEQILLGLTFLQSREIDLATAVDTIRYYTPASPVDKQTLDQAKKNIRNLSSEQVIRWTGPLIKHLNAALRDDELGRGEIDLVDQIVRAVQLPWCRNVLSGAAMTRLRAAVLLPSEQAGLLHRLRAREMSCISCGTALHDRESVTIHMAPDGTQGVECHRCVPPVSIPCVSCGDVVDLSDKAIKAMSRMQCKSCNEAKREKRPPAPEVPGDIPPDMPPPQRRVVFSGTGFGNPIATPAPPPAGSAIWRSGILENDGGPSTANGG